MRKRRNIVEFEFHTERREEMHFHQDLEMVYVLSGTAQVRMDEENLVLKEGNFILINANKRHALSLKEDALIVAFVIDFSMLSEIIENNQILFWCNTVTDKNVAYDDLRLVMNQILNRYFDREKEGALCLNSLYYHMLYILTSDFMIKADDARLGAMGDQNDSRIFEIQTYVQSNYQKQISLGELSEQLYLSNAYLSKYIKKHFGLSFMEYLNNVRLFHAVDDLLYTKKKIIRVALDNGFPSTDSFNRAFRNCYNITPSEYRNNIKQEKDRSDHDRTENEVLIKKIEKFLNSVELPLEENPNRKFSKISVDANEMIKFKKSWGKLINFGDAYSLLRSDIQGQILTIKKELGFSYIRISNIFVSSLYDATKSRGRCYNFHKLDRVLDFLLENDIRPFIELGFKPERGGGLENKDLLNQDSRIIFDTLERYKEAMEELASHLVNHFGQEEIENWYFELWKDPVLRIEDDMGWYYENFEVGYHAIKSVAPKAKVGGAGLVLGYDTHILPQVCRIWRRRKVRPDFWSVYSYQTVTVAQEGILYQKKSLDGSFITNQLDIMKNIMKDENFEIEEIFVTEWNFTFSNRNRLNDSCAQGAYIMKNCIEAGDRADMMAYWIGTDLYSEDYEADGVLSGDSGVLSRDGIKKPAFYAFHFLNFLQEWMLGKNEFSVITSNNKGNYVIVCHNSKKLNYKYDLCDESSIRFEDQDGLFEELSPLQIDFEIKHIANGKYQARIYYINSSNGSVQNTWRDMEFSQGLSSGEIDYLKRSAMPHVEIQKINVEDKTLRLSTCLEAHEIRLIDISYQF